MSYILDALRKSERERDALQGPVSTPEPTAPVDRKPPLAALGAGTALLAVGALWFTLGREPATPSAEPPAAPVAESPPAAPVATPAPALAVAPARDLAEQARLPAAEKVNRPSPPARASGQGQTAKAAASAPRAAAASNIPFVRELPEDIRRELPEMVVNIHIYVTHEAQRVLYINNRQYRRGDTIQGVIAIEEIVPDGVVMQYRGVRFKLPRPS
jgi:general secretion pathway protein B